jgi:hypothetical protein
MKQCTVSVTARNDGVTHTELILQPSSLFDAVNQARQRWVMLWWYSRDLVLKSGQGSSAGASGWKRCGLGVVSGGKEILEETNKFDLTGWGLEKASR